MNRVVDLIKQKSEVIVLSLLALFRIIYFNGLDIHYTVDSYEYISRDGFAWLSGVPDRYRLPVYPMLIDILKSAFGDAYPYMLCLLQLIVSICSIVVFYLILKKLVNSKNLCMIFTAFYATFNALTGWDKTLLTESLSLSLTVFLLFAIVSYIKSNKYKYIIEASVIIIIGSLLRAIFAIYGGLFFGFLIIYTIFPGKFSSDSEKKLQRIKILKGSLIALLPIVLILGYSYLFYNQYGCFTMSESALGQQLSVVLENEYYTNADDKELVKVANHILNTKSESLINRELYDFSAETVGFNESSYELFDELKQKYLEANPDIMLDPKYEKFVEKYIDEIYSSKYDCDNFEAYFLARQYIMGNYDRNRIEDFVNDSKNQNIAEYMSNMIYNTFDNYKSYIESNEDEKVDPINGFIEFTLFTISFSVLQTAFIALIEFAVFLYVLIKKKRTDWIRLGLAVFIIAGVILSVVGTNGEYARTAITSLPFVFTSLSLLCYNMVNRIKQSKWLNLLI